MLKMMGSTDLRHRALRHAHGAAGFMVKAGNETRVHRELVEEGHLYQEIDGDSYRFTLSPSGRKLLDSVEGV